LKTIISFENAPLFGYFVKGGYLSNAMQKIFLANFDDLHATNCVEYYFS
jgi:hypothetical protein